MAKLATQITERYNQYKKMYEYYTKEYIEENCTDEELSIFYGMFAELMGDADVPNVDVVLNSSNGVTRGNAIIDIIEALNNPEFGVDGKNILEISVLGLGCLLEILKNLLKNHGVLIYLMK